MGFFDSVGSVFEGAKQQAGQFLGGSGALAGAKAGLPGMLLGGLAGEKLGNQISGGGPDQPGAPGTDPRLAEIKRRQEQQAKDFRSNIEGFKSQQFNQLAREERRNLAKRMSDVRRDAARRGIMFSGIRQGNEAATEAESAGNLAKARFDINDLAEAQAQELEADAINSGVAQQKMQQSIHDSVYNQAMQRMLQRRAGLSSLMGAGGTAVGMASARK